VVQHRSAISVQLAVYLFGHGIPWWLADYAVPEWAPFGTTRIEPHRLAKNVSYQRPVAPVGSRRC